MSKRQHTKFIDDENIKGSSGSTETLTIVKETLHDKVSQKSWSFQQSRKRSATDAFEGAGRARNVPRNGHVSPINQSKSVNFTEENTESNINGIEKQMNASGRPRLAKKGQLRLRAEELRAQRNALPIAAHANEIRQKLRNHDVLLLVGETGSGKSTQVPQFLMNEPWCKAKTVSHPVASDSASHSDSSTPTASAEIKVGGCIAITQPRRLAAISLASRVAAELGTPLGSSSPSSQVGYSVRFDTSVSPCTRIKFLTEGMLLQEMLRDPDLRQYSAVIVDEVHERGVNVDLVLGFLRRMVCEKDGRDGRGGVGLKVVVMSATADMEGIENYFSQPMLDDENGQPGGSCDSTAMNGRSENGEMKIQGGLEDSSSESSWSGISSPSQVPDQPRDPKNLSSSSIEKCQTKITHSLVTSCYIKGRQYPVHVIYTPSPAQDILDSALHTILHTHTHEPLPGDILVFLTGQETVENLASLCQEAYLSLTQDPKVRSTIPKLLILPLFAALPQHVQQRVFEKTPPRTRKVILSTNIAETSLTVPGIRHVIDSGKCKKKQFRSLVGLDSLLVKPISKSAANQRKGRAGREAPGTCYRLYTERDYLLLDQDNDPEILRCDLSQTILTLKARRVDDIHTFPLLTPLPRPALARSLLHLLQLSALSPLTSQITALGQHLALLPLPPSLGRVLLSAASPPHACLAEAIDIISALSVENIFLNPASEEQREAAALARRDLYRREGDHLTLLAAVQAYTATDDDRRDWCDRHAISHRAMQAVVAVRKQLLQLTATAAFHNNNNSNPNSNNKYNDIGGDPATLSDRIRKSLLTGLLSHTARLMPDATYRTLMGNHPVAIHPASVLYGRKCEAIVYSEYVFTTRAYARGVSEVRVQWVGEVLEGNGEG